MSKEHLISFTKITGYFMCAGQHGPVFGAATPADIEVSANEAFIVDFRLFSVKGTFDFIVPQPANRRFHDIA